MASFVALYEKVLLLIQTKCSFIATSPYVLKGHSPPKNRQPLRAGGCLALLALLPCWTSVGAWGLICSELGILDLVLATWIYLSILLCDVHHPSAKHTTDCCAYTGKWLHDYNMIRHIHAIFNLVSTGNSKNAVGTDPLWARNCSTVPGPQKACMVHACVCAATFSQLSLLLCYRTTIWLGRHSIQN